MAGSNSLAAQIRKVHIHTHKLIAAAKKCRPEHRHEAALHAHVLSGCAEDLSRVLGSHSYFRAEPRAAGERVPFFAPRHKKAGARKNHKGRK
jgi:hypothetical protein